MPTQKTRTMIQLSSTESLKPLHRKIRNTAERFGLGIRAFEEQSETPLNPALARYSQQLLLTKMPEVAAESVSQRMESCLAAIERLAADCVVEGSLEVLES